MEDLASHILDIAENSVRAEARLVRIEVLDDETRDRLRIVIEDDGKGMSQENARRALDPFVTSRTTRRVGMGLPLLQDAAREAGGQLVLESHPGRGTRVEAWMVRDHIDRKPVGDLAECMVALLVTAPETDFVLRRQRGTQEFTFDTREIREELEDVPLSHPAVISHLREALRSGLQELEAPKPEPRLVKENEEH